MSMGVADAVLANSRADVDGEESAKLTDTRLTGMECSVCGLGDLVQDVTLRDNAPWVLKTYCPDCDTEYEIESVARAIVPETGEGVPSLRTPSGLHTIPH